MSEAMNSNPNEHNADEHNADERNAGERSAGERSAGDQEQPQHADREEAVDEVFETRDDEMERLRATADEADKRVLMAQAEAENFRKRMRRDFEDQLKYAALPMVADILDVRDNLLRALQAAENTADTKGLQEGVAMVAKQLDDALAKYFIREIPAEGELFDPNFHEAISQMPSEQPSGMVAHVAQSGFQMHDRVVRPSQVVVSTGPAE